MPAEGLDGRVRLFLKMEDCQKSLNYYTLKRWLLLRHRLAK